MATHDYVINDQTTPAFRSDLNSALNAIVTMNSSATAPSTTYAGMFWFDTANSQLKMRNAGNSAWIIVGELDVSNNFWKIISNSIKAASGSGIDIYDSSGSKIIDLQIASEATAKAGTNNTELMTPLRVAQASGVPAGSIMPYAGSSAPSGWLLCYGQGISTTTYATLFAAVGYTYGGSGSTFNLPDLRGRVIAGQDDMGGTSANRLTNQSGGLNGDTLGATGGSETHTLTSGELAGHRHFIANGNTSDTEGSLSAANYLTRRGSFAEEGSDPDDYILAGDSTDASIGLTSSTGSGTAHNNVQPTLILNYIIRY